MKKINLQSILQGVKNIGKPLLKVALPATLLTFIAYGAAKASDISFDVFKRDYNNLASFNQKIADVSLGSGFSNLFGAGVSISKSLNKTFDLTLRADGTYESVDAIAEDPEGTQETYGIISRASATLTPEVRANIPITKTTRIQAGIGLSLKGVQIKNTNEETEDTSLAGFLGIQPSIAIEQSIGDWLTRLRVAYSKFQENSGYDPSNITYSLEFGRKLGGNEE